MDWVTILKVYIVIINLFGFFIMAADKYKAMRHTWRIPEKTLMLTALAGGSAGAWLGMQAFRHKTKKLKFTLGIPAILCLQLLLVYLALAKFPK